MVKKVEPFAFQKSTNIDEHNQMVSKLNELVDAWNDDNVFVTPDSLASAIAESSAEDVATAKAYTDAEIAKLPAKGFVTQDDLTKASYVTEATMQGADQLTLKEAKAYTDAELEDYPTVAENVASENALYVKVTNETAEKLRGYYNQTEVIGLDEKVLSDANMYTDNIVIPYQTKDDATTQHAELVGRITTVEQETDALTSEIPNAIAILDGTTTYEVKVRLTLESGETIESNLKNLGQMVNLAVKQSEAEGQFYVQFESTDGRIVRSNDFVVNPNVVADSYITSVTFVPNYTTGYLSAEIGLSNGTKFNANEVLIPTDPAIKTAIDTIESDIANISQRVTVLENSGTADNVSAQTLSVTNSVLKSIITLASGKTIEATTTLPETDVSALQAQIDDINSKASGAQSLALQADRAAGAVAEDLTATDAVVAGHTTSIATLNTKMTTAESDISALETDNVAIKNKNTSQDTEITNIKSRLSTAETAITTQGQEIANNEVIDATLENTTDGLKLTLGTGAGDIVSNIIKVGGDTWEELDLTALPTNFVSGDIIKVQFYRFNFIPEAPSWTSSPSSSPSSTPQDDETTAFIEFMFGETDIQRPSYAVIDVNMASTAISITTAKLNLVSNFNGRWLFDISVQYLNGGGTKSRDVSVERTNCSTYVRKMYRLKQS